VEQAGVVSAPEIKIFHKEDKPLLFLYAEGFNLQKGRVIYFPFKEFERMKSKNTFAPR